MNECEQIHPSLRGYLGNTLSFNERRLVARHLNLCASARKELDRLRAGDWKTPETPVEIPKEPLDLKLLRWLFKTPPEPQPQTLALSRKRTKPNRLVEGAAPTSPAPRRGTVWKPITFVFLFFVLLAFLTHFIQNAGNNTLLKSAKRWMIQKNIRWFGIKPSLELVLDLTSLPKWSGDQAPVASAYQELVTDPYRFQLYWQFLNGKQPVPQVDFNQNAVVFLFPGTEPAAGYGIQFKRAETYTEHTVLWYDVIPPASSKAKVPVATRPWTLQVVPKPTELPVVISKVP